MRDCTGSERSQQTNYCPVRIHHENIEPQSSQIRHYILGEYRKHPLPVINY